jgi:hypothetical protein
MSSSVVTWRSGTEAPIEANRLVYNPPLGGLSAPPANAIQCEPPLIEAPSFSIGPLS